MSSNPEKKQKQLCKKKKHYKIYNKLQQIT